MKGTMYYYDLSLDVRKDVVTQGVLAFNGDHNNPDSCYLFNSLYDYRTWNCSSDMMDIFPVNIVNDKTDCHNKILYDNLNEYELKEDKGVIVYRDDYTFDEALKYGEVYGFTSIKDFEDWASSLNEYVINEYIYFDVKTITLNIK